MTVLAVNRDPVALTLTIVSEFDAPLTRDLVLVTRVNSRNRSASDRRQEREIPTSWTVRSVRRFVPLKRYPCWCQAAQPEL